MDNMFEKEQLNSLVNSCQEEIRQLKKENDSLKQKLNWIAFGDDPELALRYLRKIGYVDFDEERKVYINKHNNEPFLLKDEQEKYYYIKDNELNEYTEQLEYQIKELKKRLENKYGRTGTLTNEVLYEENTKLINQQKEFIDYLENEKDRLARECSQIYEDSLGHTRLVSEDIFDEVNDILQKYKEIIGGKNE